MKYIGPGVRVVGKRFNPSDFLALVADPELGCEVEVRLDRRRCAAPWRCNIDGPQPKPSCRHTIIAQQILTTTPKETTP